MHYNSYCRLFMRRVSGNNYNIMTSRTIEPVFVQFLIKSDVLSSLPHLRILVNQIKLILITFIHEGKSSYASV